MRFARAPLCTLWCLALLAVAAPVAAAAQPLYGITLDRISGLEGMLGSLAALPRRASVRVYFDVREPASYYASAVSRLHGVASVMGELLDSSDERRISVPAFQRRVQSYLATLGGSVDIWEVGNEVNGNWTGSYATVEQKLSDAYEDVAAAGGTSALTLYENAFGPDHCGDGEAELTPTQFSARYVPSAVAAGLRYVLLSYYPTQCGGREPTSGEVALELEELHSLYPHALLGFGEVGLPAAVSAKTLAQAEQIMRWAYSLAPGLPYYVGGYFWWYGAEDVLRANGLLREAFPAALEDEAAALGG